MVEVLFSITFTAHSFRVSKHNLVLGKYKFNSMWPVMNSKDLEIHHGNGKTEPQYTDNGPNVTSFRTEQEGAVNTSEIFCLYTFAAKIGKQRGLKGTLSLERMPVFHRIRDV